MIAGGDYEPNALDETGYGISLSPCDGEDRIVTINCKDRVVEFKGYSIPTMSFEEFVNYTITPEEEE